MSEEFTTPDLVEVTRAIFDAANRGDWDAVMSFHAPDSVWDASRFDVGIFEGRSAIRGLFEDWLDAYEEWGIDLDEILNFGNGIVFVVCRQRGRLAGSAFPLEAREALIYDWADARIRQVLAYQDVG